ncbi:MAG: hypothetical protein ACKOEZ_05350, partial [Spartobacteria bacterium]
MKTLRQHRFPERAPAPSANIRVHQGHQWLKPLLPFRDFSGSQSVFIRAIRGSFFSNCARPAVGPKSIAGFQKKQHSLFWRPIGKSDPKAAQFISASCSSDRAFWPPIPPTLKHILKTASLLLFSKYEKTPSQPSSR